MHGPFVTAQFELHSVNHNFLKRRRKLATGNSLFVIISVLHLFTYWLCRCANTRMTGRSRRCAARRGVAASPAASGSDSSSESGSSSGSGVIANDERHRRAQHNVMERQRRYHLKSHFYALRDAVPGTSQSAACTTAQCKV